MPKKKALALASRAADALGAACEVADQQPAQDAELARLFGDQNACQNDLVIGFRLWLERRAGRELPWLGEEQVEACMNATLYHARDENARLEGLVALQDAKMQILQKESEKRFAEQQVATARYELQIKTLEKEKHDLKKKTEKELNAASAEINRLKTEVGVLKNKVQDKHAKLHEAADLWLEKAKEKQEVEEKLQKTLELADKSLHQMLEECEQKLQHKDKLFKQREKECLEVAKDCHETISQLFEENHAMKKILDNLGFKLKFLNMTTKTEEAMKPVEKLLSMAE